MNWYFYFYQSFLYFYLSKECVHFCHLCYLAQLAVQPEPVLLADSTETRSSKHQGSLGVYTSGRGALDLREEEVSTPRTRSTQGMLLFV